MISKQKTFKSECFRKFINTLLDYPLGYRCRRYKGKIFRNFENEQFFKQFKNRKFYEIDNSLQISKFENFQNVYKN